MQTRKKKAPAARAVPRRGKPARSGTARRAPLTRETLQKFRVVFSAVKRHFQEVEAKCGVSGAQLWAIVAIAGSNGMKVTELAQAMSIHQSTASNLIRDLERKGLVRKERGEDQRVVRVYLSKAGAEVAARAPKPAIGVLPEALERLPTAALVELSHSLDLLIEAMRLDNLSAGGIPLSQTFERE